MITMKKENALFSGLSRKEYIFFFKANRLKKKGLPVYTSMAQSTLFWIFFLKN